MARMRRVILILVLAVAPVSASGDHRTNSVGEPVFASPALAGKTIFIRGDKHLFTIRCAGL
jgi:hypothetical protein